MTKRLFALIAIVLAAGPLSAAQLYRWVDEKGNVEWRDTAPPASAKSVEQRTVGSNTIQTSTLPYSVQQAMKNYPVTLWVFECGETCNKARAHLARRGIPYTERNAQKDAAELKQLAGSTDVPLLVIGSQQHKGYLESGWDTALDSAGYPRTPIPGVKAQVQAKSAMADAAKPSASPSDKEPAASPQR